MKCIRRANIDAMKGRARNTIEIHANEVKRRVRDCAVLGKTPSIPRRGPMPVADEVGMGLAVEMVYRSLVARGRINKNRHIQYQLLRKMRGTSTRLYQSSPEGIAGKGSIGTGLKKVSLTNCPTQSDWYSLFNLGLANRMGHESRKDQSLHISVVKRILELMEAEVEGQPREVAHETLKVGAAIVIALAASLRGPEVFMTDLAGLRADLEKGRDGVMPANPRKKGTDLVSAPHVYVSLLGKLKGENNVREHKIALASTTMSGFEVRKWIERLVRILEAEGYVSGPAFGRRDGSLATQAKYNGVLWYFLEKVQEEPTSLLEANDDIYQHYSFDRT